MFGGGVVAGMLDDALANAESEIESAMSGVTLFEVFDDAKRVDVVVEAAAVAAETTVECAFACVSEGRMTDVVNKSERLREIFIEAKRGCRGARDLRHFHGVGKTAAKVVGGAAGKDLRLAGKAAKGARLHDALAITLEGSARETRGRRIDAGQERIAGIPGDRASMEIDGHSQISV